MGIVAMSIYHVVVYGVNQMLVQRTLAARTLGEAKKSYMLMAYVAFPIFVLFFGMGVLLLHLRDLYLSRGSGGGTSVGTVGPETGALPA